LVTARYRPSAFSAQVAPSRGATVAVTVDPAQQISETDRTNNVFVSQSAVVTCSTSPFGNVAASAAGGTYPLPLLNDSGCPVSAQGPMAAPPTGEREFLMRFLNSDEFDLKSRYIAGLYVGLLARDAEYNGFAFQRDALITGIASAPQLVSNFLTSQEYALRFGLPNNGDFVRLLYANILLRTPSEAEVIGHAANLTAGQSRAQLASNFLSSPEFRLGAGPRLLGFLLYAGILGREGSQFDLDGAASLISQGLLSTAIARLVDSPEFAATVLE